MKKLINLIALVMLVSTNVLTPFSYAEFEIPEVIPESEVETVTEDTGESEKILENNENTLESNEKTPENNEATPEINLEDKEELEQGKQEEELHENVLPDAQDAVESLTTNENKKEDTEKVETNEVVQPMEEKTENEMQDENLEGREVEGDTEKGEQEENLEGDEVEEDSSLQKVDEFITMEVIPNTSVTLLPGTGFNGTIKRLAGGNGATYISGNSTITQIVQTGNIPEGVITGEISEPDSEYPVYAYFTGGILYYTTQAETIYMNPDSSFMFARMSGITRLNLNNLNTENVINMSFMFRSNDVINVDISEWDTSNVTNMSFMFYYCDNISRLDLNSWDVSSVTTMESMFNGCSSLTGLDLSNWDTSSLTKIPLLFWGCNSLEYVDLSNWTTSNLTQMNNAFTSCNNLIYLNMSGWDFSSMNSMNNWIDVSNLRYPLEKLDLTNAKFSGDLSYMFDGSKAKKIILDGVETKDVTNMRLMFYRCSNLTGLDLSSFDTSNVTNMENMFNGCSNLTWLDLSNFDTSKVTNMDYIFSWCPSLEELNLSGWDFRNVVVSFFRMAGSSPLKKLNMTNTKFSGSMSYAFGSLPKLEEIKLDGVDTRGVMNMSTMFNGCSNLTELDLSSFDTSNVTDMGSMFNGCSSLTGLDLSNFDTSNVASMGNMFKDCSKLENLNLSGWDFSKAMMSDYYYGPFYNNSGIKRLNLTNAKFGPSMNYIFGNMSNLEELVLEGSDTSNVDNMNQMFYGCSSLTGLDLSSWDTSNVTNMWSMFDGCSKLTGLDLSNFDTSNVTNMGSMFNGCSNLTGLDLSNFDTSNVTNMGSMFNGCSKLENLNLSGWDFRNISNSSLMHNIRNIYDSNNNYPSLKKLNLSNTKYTGDAPYAFGGLDKIEEIKLDGADTSKVTNMSAMFYGDSKLTGLDLSSFDTSSLQNYTAMFNGCTSLEILNLDGWDLRGITTITSSMNNQVLNATPKLKKLSAKGWKLPENFYDWISRYWGNGSDIEEIDVSDWDLSQTKNLQGLFGGSRVKTIKGLETWDTSNVTNMGAMFYGCSNLIGLDLSNFDTSNVTNMGGIFGGCNKLEEINLSGWDFRSYSNASLMMNMTAGGIPSLTKLNMTNTKYTGNVTYAFGGLNKLEELNLNGADTSNVTSMNAMFNGDSNLKILDLSNFDTSNVNDMGGMFGGCSKLEEINLSGWDFRSYSNASLMMNITAGGIPSLTKLNMTNTKYTGSATYAFGGLNKLEELNLNGADTSNVTSMNAMFNGDSNLKYLDLSSFDTSNVTNMPQMFYNCSSLDELDLSNFNTSKVEIMGQMFYNTPNLKTIYASENFVTTALSGDNSSKDMFSGTISVIGGNGTKFDSNYIDEEYAKIDKVGQTGYFTDRNAINVKFINPLDGTETISTFAKGQKLTPPYVDRYHVVGGYLDEVMTQPIDLKKGVDAYSVIYVKYERNGSSGGGGGGGSSKDTDKDTHGSAEDSQKDSEENAGKEIPPVSPLTEGGLEQPQGQNDASLIKGGADPEVTNGKAEGFTPEFQQAYKFAHENGITTKDTIQSAQMNGKLTRIAMAKMLSQYAINVLGQTPDTSKTIKFRDVTSKKDADYDNGVTLAYQLGIMGQNMPNNRFRPNDEVSRAEFVTALSRLLYQTTDGEYKSTSKYYTPHMAKLYNEGIINNTDPGMKELRGYVMIMLMRSAK